MRGGAGGGVAGGGACRDNKAPVCPGKASEDVAVSVAVDVAVGVGVDVGVAVGKAWAAVVVVGTMRMCAGGSFHPATSPATPRGAPGLGTCAGVPVGVLGGGRSPAGA